MGKEWQEFEEGPTVKIYFDSLRGTHKKYANDCIHRIGFKKYTSRHDRLAIEMNKLF